MALRRAMHEAGELDGDVYGCTEPRNPEGQAMWADSVALAATLADTVVPVVGAEFWSSTPSLLGAEFRAPGEPSPIAQSLSLGARLRESLDGHTSSYSPFDTGNMSAFPDLGHVTPALAAPSEAVGHVAGGTGAAPAAAGRVKSPPGSRASSRSRSSLGSGVSSNVLVLNNQHTKDWCDLGVGTAAAQLMVEGGWTVQIVSSQADEITFADVIGMIEAEKECEISAGRRKQLYLAFKTAAAAGGKEVAPMPLTAHGSRAAAPAPGRGWRDCGDGARLPIRPACPCVRATGIRVW